MDIAKKLNRNWYNREAPKWDDIKKTTVGSMHKAEELNKIIGLAKDSILDLGCGTGRHVIPLAEKGYRCYGIDISAEMLRILKKKIKEKKLNIHIAEGDIANLPYKDNSFDMVLCMFHTLEFLRDRINVFKEAKRVLKKDGYFFVQVHNIFFPSPKMILALIKSFFLWLKGKKIEFGDTYTVGGHTVNVKRFQHYSNVFEMKRYAKITGLKLVEYGFHYKFADRKIKLADFFVMDYIYKKI